jgi:myosin-crossreactive antigen
MYGLLGLFVEQKCSVFSYQRHFKTQWRVTVLFWSYCQQKELEGTYVCLKEEFLGYV